MRYDNGGESKIHDCTNTTNNYKWVPEKEKESNVTYMPTVDELF